MILGLVSVSTLTGILYFSLRPLYLEWQTLKREKQSLEENIGRYRKYAEPAYVPPLPMSDGEKTELNKRVPAQGNGPEVVVHLEQAASQVGVTLSGIELVEDVSQLPFQTVRRGDTDKGASKADSSGLYDSLGVVRDPHLKPVWYKVEVQATKDKLAAFLEGLANRERLVTVAGWDFGWTETERPEKLVVYVLVYHYRDPKLKMPGGASAPTPSPTSPASPSMSASPSLMPDH
jgi:hypothetical protein